MPPRAVFARLAAPRVVGISWVEQKQGGAITGYEILRGGRLIASVSERTSITEGGLAPGVEYCWAVRALGIGGLRSEAVTGCVKTPAVRELYEDELAEPALAAPDVTLSVAGRDEIRVSWGASRSAAGAVRYEVVRDNSVKVSTADTSTVAKRLTTATRYCFTVTARDTAGNSSAPSEPACVMTPDVTPPSAPGQFVATAVSSSEIALSWSGSTDDVGVVTYEISRDNAPLMKVTALGARDSGRASGSKACYFVRAFDAAGNVSPPSAQVCATTPAGVPAAPLELKAEALGEASVRVTWSKPKEDVAVAEYEIVQERAVRARAAGTSAEVKGLPPGKEACFLVRARTAAGVASADAGPVCARTPDLTPPSPPPALAVSPVNDREVRVHWGTAPDNVGTVRYKVERDGKEVASVETTEASEKDLRPGQSYCYDVTAEDAAGNRSPPAKACATTPDLTPPSVPAAVLASAPSSRSVEIGWEPAADDVGVVGYEVLRGDSVVATVKESPAVDAQLRPKTKYCYTVRAFDAAGNRSPKGSPVCATTPRNDGVPGPRQLRAASRSSSSLELSWEGPKTGVVYLVSRDDEGQIGATTSTRYLVRGPNTGERHCYRVVAVDDGGKKSAVSLPTCLAIAKASDATAGGDAGASGDADAEGKQSAQADESAEGKANPEGKAGADGQAGAEGKAGADGKVGGESPRP